MRDRGTKVEPHLGHVDCKEIRYGRTGQSLDVLAEIVPRANLGQLRELPGTIAHPKIEESCFHGMRWESPTTPSSASAECGAAAAWWSKRA